MLSKAARKQLQVEEICCEERQQFSLEFRKGIQFHVFAAAVLCETIHSEFSIIQLHKLFA
jgi:hypothetical protein